jgi:8-oxo-dGTP pyrophosphatase MutT (NUDIX family)
VPTIDEIRGCFGEYTPRILCDEQSQKAAVAMVLREGEGRRPEVLFIKRADRPADPWSGHMAFPGGRVARGDATIRSAAERETLEEVGLSLKEAERLGRLDDLEGLRDGGRSAGIVISAFVYHHRSPGPLRVSEEVEEAFWVSLSALYDPLRRVEYSHPLIGATTYPGILVGDPDRHVVWGLTYRFVESFLSVTGRALPDRLASPGSASARRR